MSPTRTISRPIKMIHRRTVGDPGVNRIRDQDACVDGRVVAHLRRHSGAEYGGSFYTVRSAEGVVLGENLGFVQAHRVLKSFVAGLA